jgi:hypothetical protein
MACETGISKVVSDSVRGPNGRRHPHHIFGVRELPGQRHSGAASASGIPIMFNGMEEVGRRLDQVLKSIDEVSPDRLRQVRACEVLEGIRSPEAVRLLREWSGGPTEARLTTEAKESLERLRP